MVTKKTRNEADNDRYSKDHQERVLTELESCGFLLELKTNEMLEKSNWATILHMQYWNIPYPSIDAKSILEYDDHERSLIGKTGREIDIYAVKGSTIEHPIFSEYSIELVIDCKRRFDENWVFYTSKNLSTIPDSSSILASHILSDGTTYTYLDFISEPGFERFTELRDELDKISHQSWLNQNEPARASVSLFKNDKSIFAACNQIVDAYNSHLLENLVFIRYDFAEKRKLGYWRLYPVIVFDGPMWELKHENSSTKLEPAKWITLYFKKGKVSYSIDFVNWNSFPEYLNLLENELKATRKILLKVDNVS